MGARGPGGPQWKASFGPEGFTYIPFFGSDAPQNYPVEFDLVGAFVAGEPIALSKRLRKRDEHAVTLDRGSLKEVYHLTKDTVEQTFVFEVLPQRGEIVLEIDVDTELYKSELFGGGFSFSNELGEVHYGRAVALDGRGTTLEVQQFMTQTGIRIVIPADFVRAAKLPLVIDPILSTLSVVNDSRRQTDVDVAYEANNTTYQIVYSERQSALDTDILAVSYNAPLGLLFPAVSLDITSANWQMPRNASNYHEEQFLCVSRVSTSPGIRSVWGRTREAGSGARGPQFLITSFSATSVDVGGKGNDLSSSYDYMVVWAEPFLPRIHGQNLGPSRERQQHFDAGEGFARWIRRHFGQGTLDI